MAAQAGVLRGPGLHLGEHLLLRCRVGEAMLDGFLMWTANPVVKVAEFGLVFLLAVHLLGGLRVLVIENLSWRENQKQLALGGFVVAALIAVFFFLRLL